MEAKQLTKAKIKDGEKCDVVLDNLFGMKIEMFFIWWSVDCVVLC